MEVYIFLHIRGEKHLNGLGTNFCKLIMHVKLGDNRLKGLGSAELFPLTLLVLHKYCHTTAV